MMICGTYGSKKKSCNNCLYFMLWGVTYGYCSKHKEDVAAQYVCNRFKKYKEGCLKEIFINNKSYAINCGIDYKRTMFFVTVNNCSGFLSDIECKTFYTLRDTINAIKEDAFK